MSIVNGTKLKDRYEIVKKLGEGHFGNTYLAKDTDLPDFPFCVVKQLKPDLFPGEMEIAQRLFEQEAKILYKLGEHPQIPRLFAHFRLDAHFFLVQEFIKGSDLSTEISPNQKWTESAVIDLLTEILTVLAVVHQENIIHRDLKPANIMRREDDRKIMLIDFGAVKKITLPDNLNSEINNNSTIAIGTPGFIPREQFEGKPQLASDIYAVGIIAIIALIGKIPQHRDIEQLNYDFNLNLSDKFQIFLSKMVAEYHGDRYKNAQETLNTLLTLDNLVTENKSITTVISQTNTSVSVNNSTEPQISIPTIVINKNNINNSYTKILINLPSKLKIIGIFSLIVAVLFGFIYFLINEEKKDSTVVNNFPNNSTINNPKYQQLEKDLRNKDWQQADLETNRIMLSLLKREKEGNFSTTSIDILPCKDLDIINRLWQENSQQKFGFTAQKNVYLATGNKIGDYKSDNYLKFIEKLGWNQDNLQYTENSPQGHLPAPLINGYDDVLHDDVGLLFNRLNACNLL